jgi:hypothetical protein
MAARQSSRCKSSSKRANVASVQPRIGEAAFASRDLR